jgi:hypothetical protein
MLDPRTQLFPTPVVHADLAPLAALAVTDEKRAPSGLEIRLCKFKRLADPQPRSPKQCDQRPDPETVWPRSCKPHHRDDLLRPWWIGRVAPALVARASELPGRQAAIDGNGN